MASVMGSDHPSNRHERSGSSAPSRGARRRPLVGREQDLVALAALVERRFHVTIVGVAGVGKSRLAREVAARGGAQAFFCDLTQSSDADGVLSAVARVFAVEADSRDVIGAIASVLAAHGRVCLVLDGVDRLGREAWESTIPRLLDACPELNVLATARARVRVDGEAVFPLAPLGLETDGTATSPAEDLFLQLAEDTVGRNLLEDGAVPPSVRSLVRALDGIPLALEIAASTLNVLSPAEFLERRTLVLDTPAPADVWGGGSLRAALEVSWARLSANEQGALVASAVFAADFDLTAAEAVLQDDTIGVLARLCDASFLASSARGDRTRFRMFECVRQFVLERAGAGAGHAYARHAAFFGAEAIRWTHRGEVGDRLATIDWLRAEESNLSALVQRITTPGATPSDEEVDLAAGAAAGLAWLWLGRGPLEPHTRLLAEMEVLVRPRGLRESLSVATFLLALANIRRHLGDFDLAAQLATDALERSRHLAIPYLEARCHLERARLARLRGDRAVAQASVDAAEAIGELTGEASLRALVILAKRLVSRPLTEESLARASELAHAAGDPLVTGRVELAFGTLCFASGRPEEALEHLRLVDDASSRLRHHTWRALSGLVAGNALAELGRRDEATTTFERALASARAAGHRRSEAEALGNLALLDLEAGRLPQAFEGLTMAVALFSPSDPIRLFFLAALAAVEAFQPDGAAGAVTRFVAAREQAHAIAPALGAEVELFGEMLHLIGIEVPPSSEKHRQRAAASFGASRVARRVRETVRARLARDALVIGRDASWFRPPHGATVSLSTRPVLRSLLRELVNARASSEVASRDRIVRVIWPDERSSPRSMGNRLSVALSTLRSLGLRALVTTAHGVSLDSATSVIQLDDPEPPKGQPDDG